MAPRSDPFARVRAAAAHLPEVEESTSYGTPSLKVRGKSFVRLKDADTLVVMCPVEEKEMLMEADPKVYFETDPTRAGRRCWFGSRPSARLSRATAWSRPGASEFDRDR